MVIVERPKRTELSRDVKSWLSAATATLSRRRLLRIAMGTGMVSISGGLLAACGGDDDDDDSGSGDTTAVATESATETETEETATETESEETAAETESAAEEETTEASEEASASPSEDEAQSTGTDEDMANCQVGGTLVYALSSDPPDMDPQVSTGGAAESVKVQIYTGLLTYAADASIIPELAEKWEVSDDGLGYQFDLRQDVVFHDGTPFTSADAKASYERILDPAVAASNFSYFSVISTVDTPDDYTMTLELSAPSAPLQTYMANEYALILSKDFLDAGGDPNTESIGTGPFKLDSHEAGVRISVVKNEAFYGDVPGLDQVDLIPYADEDTRMAALFAGEVQVAESVPWKDYQRITEDESLKLHTSEGSSFMCVMYQTQTEPFNDPAVRYALNWAYDRQAVIDIVFFGQGKPITGGLVPPGLWGHNEELDGTFGYDPEKAKQLLAEAGYPDGFDCTLLSTSQYKMHQTTGEVVQQNLRDIGVNCELELFDWATVVDRSNRGEFQFRIHGLGVGGADPDTILSPSFDSTSGRAKTIAFENEEVDSLLHEARALTDQDERKKLYDEVQRLVLELSPFSLLNYRVDATATTADVRGFERYLVGPSTWSLRRSRVGCSE